MDSLWTSTAQLPGFPPLDGACQTDVLIIGGGLAGILTAYALKEAGIDYLLIEADTIGAGVTANTTAKITAQHGLIYDKLSRRFGNTTARMYYDANTQALDRYRRLCQNISCDFENKSAYVYSLNAPEKLEQEMRTLSRLSIPFRSVREIPLPFSVAGAIAFADQGQFHPLNFLSAIAQGLNIREHTSARAFHGMDVLTNRGSIRAEKIVIATHFPMLNKHGSYFLKLYQHRSYVLGLEGGPQVDGMYLDEAQTGLSFRNQGDLLLLGGGSHRTGKQGGGWAELEAFARLHYPKARLRYRWATQDCMSLDGVPYIGQYSARTPDLLVATGFNKWGMTSSMAASSILCDLLQGKESPYAALFSPSRSILHKQLAINGWDAVTNLLTPTRPRCPHMGCALKWNAQERSWDCPCHGSRFDESGKLLNNPANGDLKKRP